MMRTGIAIVAACTLAGCTSPAVNKAVGSGTDGDAPIVVRMSDSAVTVENHAGRPLLNVRATITTADGARPFVGIVPTIDVGATSDLALSTFRTDEGAVFDASAARPTQLVITARDTLAKSYELTLPWKR